MKKYLLLVATVMMLSLSCGCRDYNAEVDPYGTSAGTTTNGNDNTNSTKAINGTNSGTTNNNTTKQESVNERENRESSREAEYEERTTGTRSAVDETTTRKETLVETTRDGMVETKNDGIIGTIENDRDRNNGVVEDFVEDDLQDMENAGREIVNDGR